MLFGLINISLLGVTAEECLCLLQRTLTPVFRGCLGRWVRPRRMGVPLPAIPRLPSVAASYLLGKVGRLMTNYPSH